MTETLAIHGGKPVRTQPFGPSHDFGDEEIAALTEIVRSGVLDGGGPAAQFELEFAARHGVKHAVAVSSGTAAMHTCVAAVNPDPGEEIIVTPWTSGGSVIGMLLQNVVPIFADVDDTYTLDPVDVEARITPRTRAIMAVHLFGNPCDMAALREIAKRHDLFLIEDASQAHFAEHQGQLVGTMADISGYSFGGPKHLTAGGGGIVVTDNDQLWERAVLFRDAALPRDPGPYAGRPYANYFLAPNYKISDLTAAVLLTQFQKVEGYIERKIHSAQQIVEGLSDLDLITPQRVRAGDRHTYWILGFTLETDKLGCDALEFAEAVSKEGVSMSGPYIGSGREGPLYRNPFLSDLNCYGRSRFPFDHGRERPVDYRQVKCPNGEELMGRGINFLMMPSFSEADCDDVVSAIRKVAGHYAR